MVKVPKFTESNGLSVSKTLKQVGRATPAELTELTGNRSKNVLSTLRTLHGQSKIHIGDWEITNKGRVNPVWFWGDGDDKREPMAPRVREFFTPRPDLAAAWMFNV